MNTIEKKNGPADSNLTRVMTAVCSAVVVAFLLVTAPASGQLMHDVAQTAVRPATAPDYGDVAFRYGWVRSSSFPTVADAKNAIRDFHATRVDWFYPSSHAAAPGATYVSTDGQDFIDWTQTNNMKIVGAMNTNTTNLAWRLTDGPSGRYIGDPSNSAYTQEAVNWGKAQVDAGVDAILIDDFFYYNTSQQQQFNDNVIAPIKAYSASQGYAGGIKIASNNGSFIDSRYVSNYDFDFHYSDNNFTPGPGAMWQASKDHRAQQSAFLMHPNRPMTKEDRRSLIGLGYATGSHVITPWDEYTSSAAGGGRLFEDPADFADLYGFARSLDQQGYLNGYEDAAVGGFDLSENRYGTAPIVVSGASQLSVFGRAKPGDANAPVVLHLVESGNAQSSTLRLNSDALLGTDNVGFSLLTPTAYDANAHGTAYDTNNYLSLSQSTNLSYYVDGDDLVLNLPGIGSEWGTLVATPGAGTPSPAPQPTANTIAYWNAASGSNNTLVDLAGGDQTLVGGTNVVTASGSNVAPFPVPNPDSITSGGNGSIYMSSQPNVEAPHTNAASIFQMTDFGSFTFEGWIQAADGATGYIASDRHQGNSYRGWFLELQGSGGIQFYSNSGGTATTITSAAIDDGTAHHFAAVWDHLSSEMRLFIDGILVGSPTFHDVGSYDVYGFSIGGRDGTTGGNDFVDNRLTAGTRLDELRFSNAALDPSQFLNANPIPTPASFMMGLVGLSLVMARRRGRAR
jgi:hypothetical protein